MANDNYTSVTMPQQVFTSAVVAVDGVKYFAATYPESVYDSYGFRAVQAWSAGVYRVTSTTYATSFVSNAFTTGFH